MKFKTKEQIEIGMDYEEDHYTINTPNGVLGVTESELNDPDFWDSLNRPIDPKKQEKMLEALRDSMSGYFPDDIEQRGVQ